METTNILSGPTSHNNIKYKRKKPNNICKKEFIQQKSMPFPTMCGRLHGSNITRKMHSGDKRYPTFMISPILLQKKYSISRSHFTFYLLCLLVTVSWKQQKWSYRTWDKGAKGKRHYVEQAKLNHFYYFQENKLHEKYLFWKNWGGTSMHSPHLHALFSTRVKKTKLSSFYRLHWASFAIKSFRDSSFSTRFSRTIFHLIEEPLCLILICPNHIMQASVIIKTSRT